MVGRSYPARPGNVSGVTGRPSRALASRSACALPARGIQRSGLRRNRRGELGGLGGQRPQVRVLDLPAAADICSTTSLESIRTSTSVRAELGGRLQAGDQPRYSATLLVVTPSPPDALGEHLAGARRRAPRRRSRPGRGCRATRRRPRRRGGGSYGPVTRALRTRIAPHSSWRTTASAGADCTSASAVRSSSSRHAPQRRSRSGAAPAPPLGALPLVERHQVGGQPADQLGPLPRPALLRAVQVGDGVVAAGRWPRPADCLRLGQLGLGALQVDADGLALLHHLQQLVLQHALPPGQGVQLVLQVDGLLGGRCRTG